MFIPGMTVWSMGMPGPWEVAIIAGVVVLLFGAAKLPKIGKGLGEGIRNFKSSIKDASKEPAAAEAAEEEAEDSKDDAPKEKA